MNAKFIICNGREHYASQLAPSENEPLHEFTLMVEHIVRFGKASGKIFKTWLVCRDMFRENIKGLWLAETPEQIREMINGATE